MKPRKGAHGILQSPRAGACMKISAPFQPWCHLGDAVDKIKKRLAVSIAVRYSQEFNSGLGCLKQHGVDLSDPRGGGARRPPPQAELAMAKTRKSPKVRSAKPTSTRQVPDRMRQRLDPVAPGNVLLGKSWRAGHFRFGGGLIVRFVAVLRAVRPAVCCDLYFRSAL
jgi:hypothetical protein